MFTNYLCMLNSFKNIKSILNLQHISLYHITLYKYSHKENMIKYNLYKYIFLLLIHMFYNFNRILNKLFIQYQHNTILRKLTHIIIILIGILLNMKYMYYHLNINCILGYMICISFALHLQNN